MAQMAQKEKQPKGHPEKFVVLFTGINSEVAFGPFDSIETVKKDLQRLGFKRINDIWWQKTNIDAYIRSLYLPDEMGK